MVELYQLVSRRANKVPFLPGLPYAVLASVSSSASVSFLFDFMALYKSYYYLIIIIITPDIWPIFEILSLVHLINFKVVSSTTVFKIHQTSAQYLGHASRVHPRVELGQVVSNCVGLCGYPGLYRMLR